MLLSSTVRRILLAGIFVSSIAGCASFEMPEPVEIFKSDYTNGKIKHDHLGNVILPN